MESNGKPQKRTFDGSNLYLNKISYPDPIPENDNSLRLTFKDLLDLDHNKLERAFLTTYIWDTKFITNYFPDVPVSLACHWAPPKKEGKRTMVLTTEEGQKREIEVIHPHFPSDIEGNVHSKLLLFFYETHLRVVITTANLQERDWDALSQVIWAQDFYKKSETTTNQTINQFAETLLNFVESFTAPAIFSLLKVYDFSTAKVKLITSVPGLHRGFAFNQYGHMKLRSLLSQNAWPTETVKVDDKDVKVDQKSKLEYQTATIGAIRKDWMDTEFLYSCAGKEYKENEGDLSQVETKILFPTHQSVAYSNYIQGGRSICCWDKSGVTKPYLFHVDHSIRKGVLMHSKVLVRSLESNPSYGWLYAGSHNLSASAWGRLADGGLYINNYEIGVLFESPKETNPKEEESLKRFSLPYSPSNTPYQPTEKPWLIPIKPKVMINSETQLRIHLYILPQKYTLIPKPEKVKEATGATVSVPAQACINVMQFGTCKYGNSCRYSHSYQPVEVTGTAAEALEGCRFIMVNLAKTAYSMGVTITINDNLTVQGWLWMINDQWRYTMFIPDPKHPLSKQFNMDVFMFQEQNNFKVENHVNDLSFLSGAGLTVVPAKNYDTTVDNKETTGTKATNSFSINGVDTTYTKLVYIFGTKGSIKTAVSDIVYLMKHPNAAERKGNEEHIEPEYRPKEEKLQ